MSQDVKANISWRAPQVKTGEADIHPPVKGTTHGRQSQDVCALGRPRSAAKSKDRATSRQKGPRIARGQDGSRGQRV